MFTEMDAENIILLYFCILQKGQRVRTSVIFVQWPVCRPNDLFLISFMKWCLTAFHFMTQIENIRDNDDKGIQSIVYKRL